MEKVEVLHSQDYHQIKSACIENGQLFTDPIFPPDGSSLGRHYIPGIVWKRPQDIHPTPCLVVDGLAPSDLNQGELGNCWFVAACSSLALEKDLWDRVVPDASLQEWDHAHPGRYCGVFHFRFWHYGRWVDVVVDDWLPTKGGHLVFMKSRSSNEFWSALLEKAYAKLSGSYGALVGGRTGDALVSFTSGVSQMIAVELLDCHDKEGMEGVFRDLLTAHQHKSLISCSIAVKPGIPPNAQLECGLINGHAYSITDIKELETKLNLRSLFGGREKLMMIKLRNPWGKKEWNGPWSDSSEEWERVRKTDIQEVHLVVEDDGEFWMELHDWYSWFSHATVCHIATGHMTDGRVIGTYWYIKEFHGEWARKLMGGAIGDVIMHNPQYALTVGESQLVMVDLMQKLNRKEESEEGKENYSIGFVIVKIEHNRIHRTYAKHRFVHKVKFMNIHSVSGRFTLEPGRYAIVPATYLAGKQRDFLLRVYSQHKTSPFELKGTESNKCSYCSNGLTPPIVGVVSLHIMKIIGLEHPNKQELSILCAVHCDGETAVTPPIRGVVSSKEPLNIGTDSVFYIRDHVYCTVGVEVISRSKSFDRYLGETTPIPLTSGRHQHKLQLHQHHHLPIDTWVVVVMDYHTDIHSV